MLNFIFEVILWVFFLYGVLSAVQDYINYNTYKKIEENIKLVMAVKNAENGIEQYIRELTCGRNFFNQLVVVDLDSTDDTGKILQKLEKEKYNMKVLDKKQGKEYLNEMIK